MRMSWASLLLFLLPISVCRGQTALPDHLPELTYPPIAKAAHVEGDVIVRYRKLIDGSTANVMAESGPAMLCGIAVEQCESLALSFQ